MIALLLAICTAYGNLGVTVTQSTDYHLTAQVYFSEINKRENVPITRFILAERPPHVDYQVTGIDSVTHRSASESGYAVPVKTGEPITIGNSQLFPVTIYPSYVDGNNHIFIKSVEIETDILPSSNRLELPNALSQVFEKLVLNYSRINNPVPAGYLIIAPDAFIDELAPLASWKEKLSWVVSQANFLNCI